MNRFAAVTPAKQDLKQDTPGWFETVFFTLEGSRLLLNTAVPVGSSLEVHVFVEGDGNYHAKSVLTTGVDHVELECQWEGGTGLRGLIGRDIKLKFYLAGEARLYSFQAAA